MTSAQRESGFFQGQDLPPPPQRHRGSLPGASGVSRGQSGSVGVVAPLMAGRVLLLWAEPEAAVKGATRGFPPTQIHKNVCVRGSGGARRKP